MSNPIHINETGSLFVCGREVAVTEEERQSLFRWRLDLGSADGLQPKTLTNTTAKGARQQVKDIEFWGDGDTFRLISKASSQAEGWMKSTKAMQITDVGCVVQVTTQQGDNVAEAVTFVPNTRIIERVQDGKVVERKLVGNTIIPSVLGDDWRELAQKD